MQDNRKKAIIENKMLNRKIAYAINKAISDDVPQLMRENRLETNNRYIFAAGDCINNNLRKHVVKDEVELIAFRRYGWEGRIIVDRINKVTYTICTHQNLRTLIRKNRSNPHYLMTILYIENGECEGTPKQMSIGDFCPGIKSTTFETEILEEDYEKIMQGNIGISDGYKHYIVAYTAEHHTIMNIELLLLDKDFAEVDKLDLMEYVTPDFASLTEYEYNEEKDVDEDKNEEKPMLLKLKPGVKPALRVREEEV